MTHTTLEIWILLSPRIIRGFQNDRKYQGKKINIRWYFKTVYIPDPRLCLGHYLNGSKLVTLTRLTNELLKRSDCLSLIKFS